MQVKVGTFTSPLATGNQSVAGIGFQPDLVIFTGHENPSEGRISGLRWFLGMAKSSTEQWVNAIFNADGAATQACKHWASDVNCIFAQDGGSGIGYQADFVSMDSDGFTVNWSDIASTARIVGYIAIKGGGQLQLKLGKFMMNSSTGNQAVTGLGFSPKALLFCNCLVGSTEETINANSHLGIGFAVSSSQRGAFASGGKDGNDVSEENSYLETDKCILQITPQTSPVVKYSADFVSMDSDGFTINVTVASGSPEIFYLAIGGCSAFASNMDLSTSTGNQSKTGAGFQPDVNFFISDAMAAHAGSAANYAKYMFGCAYNSTNRMVCDGGCEDGFGTSNCDTWFKSSQCIESPDPFNNNNDCQADFVSNDSDGFTINNSAVDAVSRRVLSLSVKEDAAPAGGQPMYSRRKDQKFLKQSPALLAA